MEYQIYESYDTFLLYQEFLEIPGNTFKFRLPEGMILTTEMMHIFLRAAYMSVGRMELSLRRFYFWFELRPAPRSGSRCSRITESAP